MAGEFDGASLVKLGESGPVSKCGMTTSVAAAGLAVSAGASPEMIGSPVAAKFAEPSSRTAAGRGVSSVPFSGIASMNDPPLAIPPDLLKVEAIAKAKQPGP